jgi:tRNA nucleotidyltransferase/poly(A) polymerase
MGEGGLKKAKILQIIHRLAQKRGEEVYLVGGAVRDFLLGRPLGRDFDFVAKGEVHPLAQELAREMDGHAFPLDEGFGTWRVIIKKAKRKTDADFCPLQGQDIIEDLRQRDFTVNSLAVSLKDILHPELPPPIDPLGGLADLRAGILRANSETSLLQDPLRMLRAFRLASALGLRVEEETLAMIRRNKNRILNSAWERIRTEFLMGLNAGRAGEFLRGLYRSGLLEAIFPEVKEWEGLDQGAHHDFPLQEHAFRNVEAAEFIFAHFQDFYPAYAEQLGRHFSLDLEEGIPRKALFKFVAFFHDSGKPGTRSSGQEGQPVRFLDHDLEGQKINAAIARRMKLSRKSIRIISDLTRHHMRVLSLSKVKEVTSRARYRFFRDLGKEGIDMALLGLADGLASRKLRFDEFLEESLTQDFRRIKEVAGELIRYYFEEFSQKPPAPLLDGREIMEALGLPEGRAVGSLLARLREAEMGGMVGTREEALDFLKNIDRSRLFG